MLQAGMLRIWDRMRWINFFNVPNPMLQTGMLRIRDPMRWINFFNVPIPSGSTLSWGSPASKRNEYQKMKNNVSGE
jgi:hypothetical protein